MLLDAAFSFLHFAALLILVGAVSAQAFILRLAPSLEVVRLLSRADAFYGASAVALLAAGICRVAFGLKDPSFYLQSHAFWGKMALFALIGALSVGPTMRFLRWSRAARTGALPAEAEWKATRRVVFIETHLLLLVVLLAVLMARGIG